MDKEKVTEELVRQNGNQAAAVMADYASQGGGSTSGITTIDKNTQPNIVWREPTEEDLAKFNSSPFPFAKVADLPDGKVPLLVVMDDDGELSACSLTSLSFPVEEFDGHGTYGSGNQGMAISFDFVLSWDWSLLGIIGDSPK